MIKNELPKLNLQLHTDGAEPPLTPDPSDPPKEKTLEEILAEKQKEWEAQKDREISKAHDKWKKEQEEKERLAKLTEEERVKEIERVKEEEIKERERQLDIKDSKLHIYEVLRDNDLLDAASFFKPENYLGENKEALTSDIEALKQIVKAEIEKITAGVSEQILTGKTPPVGKDQGEKLTKEDFNKLSYSQRVELLNKNPELYKQLSK